MIKRIALVSFLSISSLHAGFFDSIMEVVKSPEVQKAASSAISSSTLINDITKDTNLDLKQSASAVSDILSYSKSNMSEADYAKVSKEIPGFEQLIGAGITKAITSSDALNASFNSMGIDPALIQVIVPIIIEFVKNNASIDSADILSKSLSSFLK